VLITGTWIQGKSAFMEFKAKDKYWSMMRAYERLKRISTNNGNTISNAEPRDAAEDFFNQCYHYKDWLQKDPEIELSHDVEDYIDSNPPLSLAADFCNSLKHAGLSKDSRSGKHLQMINTHMTLNLTPAGFIASGQLDLTISGNKYNCFELATSCIKAWDAFLDMNSIVISAP